MNESTAKMHTANQNKPIMILREVWLSGVKIRLHADHPHSVRVKANAISIVEQRNLLGGTSGARDRRFVVARHKLPNPVLHGSGSSAVLVLNILCDQMRKSNG